MKEEDSQQPQEKYKFHFSGVLGFPSWVRSIAETDQKAKDVAAVKKEAEVNAINTNPKTPFWSKWVFKVIAAAEKKA